MANPDTGFDTPSARDEAFAELERRGRKVVPVLIRRLEEVFAADAAYRARAAAIQDAWDAWRDEGHRLSAEHGLLGDFERYRKIPTQSLPEPLAAYHQPYELEQGITEALHRLGDERAVPVLCAALREPGCVLYAARALRDIRDDRAVPALLDAAAMTADDDYPFGPRSAAGPRRLHRQPHRR
ncbi:MAG: hypothetical protein GEV11_22955 [Streptosporangiales bacterium]|nr:hypothetical protein [Streptosporangiales bacterium]